MKEIDWRMHFEEVKPKWSMVRTTSYRRFYTTVRTWVRNVLD